jgi:hypothetical protein
MSRSCSTQRLPKPLEPSSICARALTALALVLCRVFMTRCSKAGALTWTPRNTRLASASSSSFIRIADRQENPNLEQEAPEDGDTYTFELAALNFQNPAPTEPPIELGRAQRRLFDQRPQAAHLYDVIVIGSGMAGGHRGRPRIGPRP